MTDPHDVIEFYDERAAIREYDGVMPRKVAEGYALQDVRDRYGRGAERVVIGCAANPALQGGDEVKRHRENNK